MSRGQNPDNLVKSILSRPSSQTKRFVEKYILKVFIRVETLGTSQPSKESSSTQSSCELVIVFIRHVSTFLRVMFPQPPYELTVIFIRHVSAFLQVRFHSIYLGVNLIFIRHISIFLRVRFSQPF